MISWALPVVWPGAVYSLEVGITGTEGVITIDDTHRDIVLATTKESGEGYAPDKVRRVDFLGSYPPGDMALGELRGPMREETEQWLNRISHGPHHAARHRRGGAQPPDAHQGVRQVGAAEEGACRCRLPKNRVLRERLVLARAGKLPAMKPVDRPAVVEDIEDERRHVPLLKQLGPGLITGAADDDPSGIATYSQAGAQFGYGLLWSLLLTTPLMIGIQMVSARIGRVTGHGLAANIREHFPRPAAVRDGRSLLLFANTINIAADLGAMGDALLLVAGGSSSLYIVVLRAGLAHAADLRSRSRATRRS